MANVEQGLIYEIYAHGRITKRDPCRIQTTKQHDSLRIRVIPSWLPHSDILFTNTAYSYVTKLSVPGQTQQYSVL